MHPRSQIVFAAVLVLALVRFAIPAAIHAMPAKQSDEPIGIGVLNPTTGDFASFGERVNAGIQLYFDSIDNLIGDRSIQLVFADTGGDPQQALEAARRLVDEDRVDLLMGVVNSNVVMPIVEFADENAIPLILTVGGARDATGDGHSPYVFRTGLANGQDDAVLGWYVANELGHQRAATIAWDILVGQERVEGFSSTFTASGGEIVDRHWPSVATDEFDPYLDALDASDVEVTYAFLAGASAVTFTRQARERELTPAVQLVASDYLTSDVLNEMGADAEGLIQAGGYTARIESDANRIFIDRSAQSGVIEPGVYEAEGYLGAQVVAAAIDAVAGDLSDAGRFLFAISSVQLDGPGGPFQFDGRGQAERTVYVTRVEEQDGGYEQTIVTSFANVDQNWSPSG